MSDADALLDKMRDDLSVLRAQQVAALKMTDGMLRMLGGPPVVAAEPPRKASYLGDDSDG